MKNPTHRHLYESLLADGLRSGESAKNPKVFLYPQSQDVAILYSPDCESSHFRTCPLGFQGDLPTQQKGGWCNDVFAAVEPFLSPDDKKVRTRGWMEFNLPPEGWAALAAVLGLDRDTAKTEFERLPPSIQAHFSPERDTPTQVTRVASHSESKQNHGVITNALEELLRLSGQGTGNDKRQDLITIEGGRVKFLFEVKSDASTQSVYTCIGQLMYLGAHPQHEATPVRVAVLPEEVSAEVRAVLGKLELRLVTFRLLEGKPRFEGLEQILSGEEVST